MSSVAWYPVSCKPRDENDEVEVLRHKLSEVALAGEWDKVFELLEEEDLETLVRLYSFVNVSLLVPDEPKFRTLLHEAALQSCSEEIIDKLISVGASKSLKTSNGETAYDIGKRIGLSEEILKKLYITNYAVENPEIVNKIEKGLHKLMHERVSELLEEFQVHLPQLCYMYEFGKFHFEVPRWLGGFNPEKHEKGILVDSFCRVWGGSEQMHIIDFEGNCELIAEGEDYMKMRYDS